MVATVTSLTSASVTTRYFERDGYYAKADPERRKASRWHGRGAAAFGLGRHVSPARIEAILSGAVPGTDVTLGTSGTGSASTSPESTSPCRPRSRCRWLHWSRATRGSCGRTTGP